MGSPGTAQYFFGREGWTGTTNPNPSRRRSRHGCLYAVLAVVAVLTLLLAAIIAIVIGAAHNINNAARRAEKSAEATCVGKAYPDQQKRDRCANAANTTTLFGVTITATPIVRKATDLGQPALCSTVTLTNTGSGSRDYSILDFKLQTPSGNVAAPSLSSFTGGTLGSGVLIAGGTKTGLVCSDDTSEKGQYVLIYKPDPLQPDRATWLFTI